MIVSGTVFCSSTRVAIEKVSLVGWEFSFSIFSLGGSFTHEIIPSPLQNMRVKKSRFFIVCWLKFVFDNLLSNVQMATSLPLKFQKFSSGKVRLNVAKKKCREVQHLRFRIVS